MGKHWVDGLYYFKNAPHTINDVKGDVAKWKNIMEYDYPDIKSEHEMLGSWNYGKYHEVIKEIEEKTGAKYFDLEMTFFGGHIKMYGVLHEDGKGATLCNMLSEVDEILLMTPEKQKEIMDARPHQDEIIPPGAKVQPENQGKILWLSGPPGAGKSTTAQYLAREKGWVYYEADCYSQGVDPFIALDVAEPSLAQLRQKALKGRSKEDLEITAACFPEFEKLIQQQPYDAEGVKPFFRILAKDIVRYKQRIGGNFAVAQAVPTREFRDCMKEVFGPQATFVTIRLSKEANRKRIEARHADADEGTRESIVAFCNGMYDQYEDAQPGEENCLTVHVEPEDTRDDVMNKIWKMFEEAEAAKA